MFEGKLTTGTESIEDVRRQTPNREKFQSGRRSSLKEKGKEKLKPRFYGSYRVVCRISEVTYKLELPEGIRIHNVFHVSCLKKDVGQPFHHSMKKESSY